jgi:competence ComEA-like helix-hairpin-helix protein
MKPPAPPPAQPVAAQKVAPEVAAPKAPEESPAEIAAPKLAEKPVEKPVAVVPPKPVEKPSAPPAAAKPFSAPVPPAASVTPKVPAPPKPPLEAAPTPPVVPKAPIPPKPVMEPVRPPIPPKPAPVMPPPKIVKPFPMEERPLAVAPRSAPVTPPAPAPVPAERPKPSPREAPMVVGSRAIPALMITGIDLNTATATDLVRRVNGIGPQLADRIVQDRAQNGPFFAFYDLARVPGIGSKAFERITGKPWREDLYGQLAIVDEIIGKWDGGFPNLRDVATRYKMVVGFDGCAIIHRDGYMLANSWNTEAGDALEAMGPQIVKRVSQYMKSICPDEIMSVTASLEGRGLTFVIWEDICFVSVCNDKGLTRKHVQIAHGVGMALGHRFSGVRSRPS